MSEDTLRVWAPEATRVQVELAGGREDLRPHGQWWDLGRAL